MCRTPRFVVVPLLLAAALAAGCRREDRGYRPAPPFGGPVRFAEEYEGNAYALSEGRRLFAAFNCAGCHGRAGGGGMGPALSDEVWAYGSHPLVVFDTISGGRPGGMPAFGGAAREPGIKVVGELPEYQRWQLVAYVRSLSGLAPPGAAPGRDDHMAGPAPQDVPPRPEVPASPPEAQRAGRQPELNGTGWVDKDRGVARIPIRPAMDAVVEAEKAKSAKREGDGK